MKSSPMWTEGLDRYCLTYAVVIGAGALSGILYLGDLSLLKVMAQQFFGGMEVFSLAAIPLYILTGILMNKARVADRLLELSEALVGRVRAGLGYVNVVASMLFAGVNDRHVGGRALPGGRSPRSASGACVPPDELLLLQEI